MARRLRNAIVGVASLLAMGVVLVAGVYLAMQQVQPFYAQALELDEQVLEQGSRELESRATALYSDAGHAGTWQAIFTAEQINGWLAIHFAADDSGELSDVISMPRVAFSDGTVSLGFRAHQAGVDTIISVDANVYLTEAGDVAVQLTSMRAGALALPVMQVADEIAAACRDLDLPIRWMQSDGQPVALVEVATLQGSDRRRISLDAIEIGDGELLVAGRTEEAMNDER